MLLLTVIVGIAFSLLLVFFRASYLDFWGTVLCVVMMSISSLFYIIMAQWFFGKMLKLVPLSGFVPGLSLLKFLALPIIVGIIFQLGSEARLFRAMLLEEANKDYVRTARSKGLSEAVVLFRHVLRNTWLPVLTHVSALLPYAFLGSIVFESFFGIPGLGTYVIEAIGGQDFAIVHVMVFLGLAAVHPRVSGNRHRVHVRRSESAACLSSFFCGPTSCCGSSSPASFSTSGACDAMRAHGQLVARPARCAGDVRRRRARRVHHHRPAGFGALSPAPVCDRRRRGRRAGCLWDPHAFDLRCIDVARDRVTRENVFDAAGVLVVSEGNAGRRLARRCAAIRAWPSAART